eukprot:scpid66245/ scgid6537/ 
MVALRFRTCSPALSLTVFTALFCFCGLLLVPFPPRSGPSLRFWEIVGHIKPSKALRNGSPMKKMRPATSKIVEKGTSSITTRSKSNVMSSKTNALLAKKNLETRKGITSSTTTIPAHAVDIRQRKTSPAPVRRFTTYTRAPTPTTVQRPASGILAATMPSGPEIKPGTFAYLVLGKAMPAKKWIALSKWPRVSVIFVTWRDDITAATKALVSPSFRSYFFPNSTWTTSRNQLAHYAKQLEGQQNWRFEFLVFFDEDVVLKKPLDSVCRGPSNPECEEKGFKALNALLIKDRPMEAGMGYQEKKPPSSAEPCIHRCHRDHNLMAFHRTAVDFLFPYDTRLDHVNWWSSAYIQNMYMAVLAPDYCSYYRQVSIDEKANEHRYYPHRNSTSDFQEFNPARLYAARKLRKLGVNAFSPDMSPDAIVKSIWRKLNPDSLSTAPCHTYPAGVNFHAVMASKIRLFLQLHQ